MTTDKEKDLWPSGMIILLWPFAGAWKAFVLSKLWLYFLVPLGLVQIGVVHAFGIGLLVAFITAKREKEAPAREVLAYMVASIAVTGAAWGIGAIIHAFM